MSATPTASDMLFDAVAFEQSEQSLIDPLHRARPFVNPTGVNLHGVGAGFDFFVGILGIEDPADADDRQPALR